MQNSEPDSPSLNNKRGTRKKPVTYTIIIRLQSVYIKMTRGGPFRMLKSCPPCSFFTVNLYQCRGVVVFGTTMALLLPGRESCVMGEQPLAKFYRCRKIAESNNNKVHTPT